MADTKTVQALNIDGMKLEFQKCWDQLGISQYYMMSLLSRDEYTPQLTAEPTSATVYYTDPASGSNTAFHPGQFVVWPESASSFQGCGFGVVLDVTADAGTGQPKQVTWLYLEKELRESGRLSAELSQRLDNITRDGVVTVTTAQTLHGLKTFTNQVQIRSSLAFCNADTTSGVYMTGDASGGLAFNAHRGWTFTASLASLSETGRFSAKQLKSEAPQGTAPVEVSSTTRCLNLNADMLDGLHSGAFARADANAAADMNNVNGCGIMGNAANANATPARHYPIEEAGMLIYGTAAYSSSCQIYGSYSSNRWFARGGGSGATSKTAWREFAFTDSTVAAAGRLERSTTIWGKSYNGTGNVLGHMEGVADINTAAAPARVVYLGAEHNGYAWGTGKGAVNVAITNNTAQTPLLLAYRKGTADMAGANRLFSMELRDDGSWMEIRFAGEQKYRLDNAGNFSAEGDVTILSDMRFKDVKHDIELRIEDVAAAPSFVYTLKDGDPGREMAGTSAQYWERLLPWLVPEKDGRKSLAYDKLGVAAAIAEARELVRLKKENAALERRVRMLEAKLEELINTLGR